MLTPLEIAALVLAATFAGAINALAGGGTLITFPALLAVGVPPIAANVTNAVALCPGYIGGTLAQSRDLQGQGPRLLLVLPAALIGGLIGGALLLQTGERLFRDLVPFLILFAAVLLAIQDPVRAWLTRGLASRASGSRLERISWLPVGLAAMYGGYFGAGASVIILAALGITTEDSLTRLNALKQFIAAATSVAAALFFMFSGQVVWSAAAAMAVGALLGGAMGGRLAGRVKPSVLRWIVVSIGVIVAVIYFVRA